MRHADCIRFLVGDRVVCQIQKPSLIANRTKIEEACGCKGFSVITDDNLDAVAVDASGQYSFTAGDYHITAGSGGGTGAGVRRRESAGSGTTGDAHDDDGHATVYITNDYRNDKGKLAHVESNGTLVTRNGMFYVVTCAHAVCEGDGRLRPNVQLTLNANDPHDAITLVWRRCWNTVTLLDDGYERRYDVCAFELASESVPGGARVHARTLSENPTKYRHLYGMALLRDEYGGHVLQWPVDEKIEATDPWYGLGQIKNAAPEGQSGLGLIDKRLAVVAVISTTFLVRDTVRTRIVLSSRLIALLNGEGEGIVEVRNDHADEEVAALMASRAAAEAGDAEKEFNDDGDYDEVGLPRKHEGTEGPPTKKARA